MSDDREWCHCEQVTSTCAKCGGKDAYRKSPLRLSGDQLSLNGAAGVTRRMKPEEKIKHLEQQLSTTKAELEEVRKANKRQPPCEQFCESRAFKSTIAKLEKELQAERAKADDIKADAVKAAIEILEDNDICGFRDAIILLVEHLESLRPKG